jgi:hypothetical protein
MDGGQAVTDSEEFKGQRSRHVLNEVKDLTHLERSFEAQDARSVHIEPETLNCRALALGCSRISGLNCAVFVRNCGNEHCGDCTKGQYTGHRLFDRRRIILQRTLIP